MTSQVGNAARSTVHWAILWWLLRIADVLVVGGIFAGLVWGFGKA
ncbi:hypothetical protein [Mycolicibacterium frederiksbergense]|nr:hypothetical protein [Mycolicibacterium frederiksbergense]